VLKTSLGRLRVIGFVEGVSFLVLLGAAMPLKYLADMPLAVKIVGSAHGRWAVRAGSMAEARRGKQN
jgi:hypothetical protein